METAAHELAIDGTSAKMEQFLHKNYKVDRLLRQNNNFAVSPKFFQAVPEMRFVSWIAFVYALIPFRKLKYSRTLN